MKRRKKKPTHVTRKTCDKWKRDAKKLANALALEKCAATKQIDSLVHQLRDTQGLNDAMARILQMARVTDAFQSLEKTKVLEAIRNFRPHYDWPKTQYEMETGTSEDTERQGSLP